MTRTTQKIALAVAAAGSIGVLAACSSGSSSSSSAGSASSAASSARAAASSAASSASSAATATASPGTTGTESLYGQATGAAAAAQLNSNSHAPLTFPSFFYRGPVNLTVAPFALPNDGNGSSGTSTLPGGLRVHHVSSLPASVSNGNAPPPAVWTYKGNGVCHFTATFDKGSYTVVPGSTGKFAGATGHGSYLITATGDAPAKMNGKPVTSVAGCSFSSTGNVSSAGAAITFSAGGPFTTG